MSENLRQRYAEALAAEFTRPICRCDKNGENEWVENPQPADRTGQQPSILFTASDGHPSLTWPTCDELAEVVAAVRDEELERLEIELGRVAALAAVNEYERDKLRERAEKAEQERDALRQSITARASRVRGSVAES